MKDADIEKGAKGSKLEKTDKDELEEEELMPISRLLKFNKPDWPYMFMGAVGAAIFGALSLSEAIPTAQIVAIRRCGSDWKRNGWAWSFHVGVLHGEAHESIDI